MSAKWNKVHRAGVGAWGVRVNAPGVPEETPYTGFLAFAKKDCGNPFIAALLDGTVSLYAMDLEASYKIQYQYYGGISKHENIVIQFNHTPCSSTKCVGTKKRDQAELYIVGTEQVEWGKKSEGDCIASMRNGFLGANANNAEVIDRDITPCVSMANKYWN